MPSWITPCKLTESPLLVKGWQLSERENFFVGFVLTLLTKAVSGIDWISIAVPVFLMSMSGVFRHFQRQAIVRSGALKDYPEKAARIFAQTSIRAKLSVEPVWYGHDPFRCRQWLRTLRVSAYAVANLKENELKCLMARGTTLQKYVYVIGFFFPMVWLGVLALAQLIDTSGRTPFELAMIGVLSLLAVATFSDAGLGWFNRVADMEALQMTGDPDGMIRLIKIVYLGTGMGGIDDEDVEYTSLLRRINAIRARAHIYRPGRDRY